MLTVFKMFEATFNWSLRHNIGARIFTVQKGNRYAIGHPRAFAGYNVSYILFETKVQAVS